MPHIFTDIDVSNPVAGVPLDARVGATEAALDLLGEIQSNHGAVRFHYGGGCVGNCDLLCLPEGELELDDQDCYLGDIDGASIYVRSRHANDWEAYQMIFDVVRGHGGSFSLDAGTGRRFIVRTRPFPNA